MENSVGKEKEFAVGSWIEEYTCYSKLGERGKK